MKTTNRTWYGGLTMLLGVAATAFLACNKTQEAPTLTEPIEEAGEAQMKLDFDRFITFSGGSEPYECTVKTSSGCMLGTLKNGTGYFNIRYRGQNTTDYRADGIYDDGTTYNGSYFTFTKGPNSSTGGPVYHIRPNQGPAFTARKILVLQVKGGSVTPDGYQPQGWFNFDVSTNTWTAQADASDHFIWSTTTTSYVCP